MKINKEGIRESEMRDGFEDGFEPLESLDLSKVKNFNDLAKAMSKTAFGGRALGEAVDVFEAMIKDKDCFVVLTLSGAMTPAKMGLIVCDMIDHGMVNAVVSTGALMTHGFVEAQGMTHFKYKFGEMDDRELYYKGYDRIYDIIELEKNLDDTEFIFREIMKNFNPDEVLCSRVILEMCGKWLKENTDADAIIYTSLYSEIYAYSERKCIAPLSTTNHSKMITHMLSNEVDFVVAHPADSRLSWLLDQNEEVPNILTIEYKDDDLKLTIFSVAN